MIEVSVKCVIKEPLTSRYVLVLETLCGGYIIPINIGEHEAEVIYSYLQGITNPRPMTYDFISGIIGSIAGVEAESIKISSNGDGIFAAELTIRTNEQYAAVDCRPSDAVALAIKMGLPVYVTVDTLAESNKTCISRGCLDKKDEETLYSMLQDQRTEFWNA